MIEDDSVFLYGALIRRRMWTPEGKRPIVVTSSRECWILGIDYGCSVIFNTKILSD